MYKNNEIPLQETSSEIWGDKYALKKESGEKVEINEDVSFHRVANSLAKVEFETGCKHGEYEFSKKDFFISTIATAYYNAMKHGGCLPAGRIISNAGAEEYKPKTSLINCVVSQKIEDSMDGIFDALHKAALSLKAGCGIGYCFSSLRPKGAFVRGAGASTNGPLAFADVFDKACDTVSSAGGRRGKFVC
jgi:ribonucleoside-diphosphate reductase alpha chain